MTDAIGLWRRLPFVLLLGGLIILGFVPKLLTDRIKVSVAPIVAMANPDSTVSTAQTAQAETQISHTR
jgi:hypothetical protein